MRDLIVRFSYWVVTDPIGWWLTCTVAAAAVVGLVWDRFGGDGRG